MSSDRSESASDRNLCVEQNFIKTDYLAGLLRGIGALISASQQHYSIHTLRSLALSLLALLIKHTIYLSLTRMRESERVNSTITREIK